MSWSIQFIGKPEKVVEALKKQSESLTGESKNEYDTALPHFIGLVSENFGFNYAVKIAASGYGQAGGETPSRQLTVSIELLYGMLD